MNLNELKPGQSGVIETVGGEGALRQHFLDMGVIPGTEVSVIKLAPLGDPMELQIHGKAAIIPGAAVIPCRTAPS